MTMTKTTTSEISKQIGGLIERMNAAPAAAAYMFENEIITMMYPLFRSWAPAFCRRSGDANRFHMEDVVSVIAENVLEVLRETKTPGKHEKVDNWFSYLYGISQYAVLAYFTSSQVTPASGMVALTRRQRLVARTRSELRNELGREPSDQEIIDTHNEKMTERRSNPSKQGALVSIADLEVTLPPADIADHDKAISDDDGILSAIEAKDLISQVIRACTDIDSELGQTAKVWIGSAYSEPPSIGGKREVARHLGVTRAQAEDLLERVRSHAQELCTRMYGINFSF